MKTVVVTGASTGIGHASAKVLLAAGFRVFGSVRQAEDADRLKSELGASFTPLVFDVTDEAAVRAGAREVDAALGGEMLKGLVNNAGIAVLGPLAYLKPDDFRRQIEVNLLGPLIVTQAFAPLLGADRSRKGSPGRVVMISSVGGRIAYPFAGPYHASKFGLEGMSEALRREFMLFGIDVVVIAPGTVATPIWGKTAGIEAEFAATPYAEAMARVRRLSATGEKTGLPPERIGDAVKTALTAARPKVRYTITPNPVQHVMMRVLPKRFLDAQIARRLGLTPRS
jgi:NAD(P)-dependent dehydrogenase (short-subunit alcohol dehydrogenase family)